MKSRLNANTFRKIPLKNFIDTLIQVYNSGVDYIDIVGKNTPTDNRDIINIRVKQEYKSDVDMEYDVHEYEEEPEQEQEQDQEHKPFSDLDIADLI